jgi:hypothetical protein
MAEIIKFPAHSGRSRLQEISGCLREQRQLCRANRLVIDRTNFTRQSCQARALDPAALGQPLQADQQRIAGKCRGGGIRRVPIGRRAKRQNLPQSLPRFRQPVQKFVCARAKITDAARGGQRDRVEQNPSRAGKRHDFSQRVRLKCDAARMPSNSNPSRRDRLNYSPSSCARVRCLISS